MPLSPEMDGYLVHADPAVLRDFYMSAAIDGHRLGVGYRIADVEFVRGLTAVDNRIAAVCNVTAITRRRTVCESSWIIVYLVNKYYIVETIYEFNWKNVSILQKMDSVCIQKKAYPLSGNT